MTLGTELSGEHAVHRNDQMSSYEILPAPQEDADLEQFQWSPRKGTDLFVKLQRTN